MVCLALLTVALTASDTGFSLISVSGAVSSIISAIRRSSVAWVMLIYAPFRPVLPYHTQFSQGFFLREGNCRIFAMPCFSFDVGSRKHRNAAEIFGANSS